MTDLSYDDSGYQVDKHGAAWERPSPLGGTAACPPSRSAPCPAGASRGAARGRFTQTPPDLAATVLLAVLSAAAGGRAVVEVRGSWREPVNLYAVAALPSGRAQVGGVRRDDPAAARHRARARREDPAARSWRATRSAEGRPARRRASRRDRPAGSTTTRRARRPRADAIAAAQLAEAITVPVMPRLIADDVTPEAAASLLAEQGGRLAVLSAEGGIFSTLAGRYSGGVPISRGVPQRPLRRHAPRRPQGPAARAHPAARADPRPVRAARGPAGHRRACPDSAAAACSPASCTRCRPTSSAAARSARRQSPRTSGTPTRSSVQAARAHHGRMDRPGRPHAHARRRRAGPRRRAQPRAAARPGDRRPRRHRRLGSKQIGATVRIAGAAPPRPPPARRLGTAGRRETPCASALAIMDYYTAHALAAFDHMGMDPVLEDARALLRWLERTRPASGSPSASCSPACPAPGSPRSATSTRRSTLLEQHGYIRRDAGPRADRPRTATFAGLRGPPTPCRRNRSIRRTDGSCGLRGLCV